MAASGTPRVRDPSALSSAGADVAGTVGEAEVTVPSVRVVVVERATPEPVFLVFVDEVASAGESAAGTVGPFRELGEGFGT